MNKGKIFEEKVRKVNESGIVVLNDVTGFPIYDKDFSTPHLTLGINFRGTSRLLYDLKEVSFTPNEVAVIMPNHLIHPLESSEDYSITLIVVSADFLEEVKHRTLTHDYSKFHFSPSVKLTDEQLEKLLKVVDVIDMVCNMTETELPNRHEILIYMFNVAFELLNAFRQVHDLQGNWQSRNMDMFNKFCNLLAMNYRQQRDITFYAHQLRLTPKYFSKVIHDSVGVTAGEWIEDYVVTQAKQILTTRMDLTVQQVGYELGFTEQSSFCRYFKRVSGMTPKQFRRSAGNGKMIFE